VCNGVVELERGACATPVRCVGVSVTGSSLPSGLDCTDHWDKDGEYSGAGLSWNRKKEVRLLAPEVLSPCWLPIVEDSGWEGIQLRWFSLSVYSNRSPWIPNDIYIKVQLW